MSLDTIHTILNYNHLNQLELQIPSEPHLKPITIDFTQGKMAYRCRFGGGRQENLARAVGLHKEKRLNILDLTAGLGQDAFILAYLGAKLIMVERHPLLLALLKDALKRADSVLSQLQGSLKLICSDSLNYIQNLGTNDYPQVIYLDPMFPENKHSAQVKKEMQILRKIIGQDNDADQLFVNALKIATHRVVVKRPKLAPPLNQQKPQFQIKGKSSRYDIYLTT